MFCNKCTSRIPDGSVFCPECGQKLTSEQPLGQNAPLRQPPTVPSTRASAPVPSAYDPLTAPLSTASFFWMPVIVAIPIVGLIVLLVWAFSKNTNVNRKHYARSVLIWVLISVILGVLVSILGGNLFGNLPGLLGSR